MITKIHKKEKSLVQCIIVFLKLEVRRAESVNAHDRERCDLNMPVYSGVQMTRLRIYDVSYVVNVIYVKNGIK